MDSNEAVDFVFLHDLSGLYRTRGEMRCFERTLLMIEVSIYPAQSITLSVPLKCINPLDKSVHYPANSRLARKTIVDTRFSTKISFRRVILQMESELAVENRVSYLTMESLLRRT